MKRQWYWQVKKQLIWQQQQMQQQQTMQQPVMGMVQQPHMSMQQPSAGAGAGVQIGGLFDCFDDIGICLCGYCCGICLVGAPASFIVALVPKIRTSLSSESPARHSNVTGRHGPCAHRPDARARWAQVRTDVEDSSVLLFR